MERIEEINEGIDLNVEQCSICLDFVTYGGERSRAKLQCGHEFHLDCIGSAFNMKGMMQCPNCRKIEKGQWLYASGSTNSSSPELSTDDLTVDNYPFFLSFAEMAYRVHVCPFRGVTQVHPSSESNLGMMNTITPMVHHQHPGGNNPHPHGWLQFHHAPFQHQHPPRFIPAGQVYEPRAAFSPYGGTHPVNYFHSWASDNLPHYPSQ
ncbi:hypothetical protein RND81_05G205000 [Saponaria officinalis]|uniref:RING-type domain-containing protein n=1 Tax=Saponaria officinalis TaxID=3572 RepID=A0AAW1KZV2_SAPOF